MVALSAGWEVICPAGAVADGGPGVRFAVSVDGAPVPAFVVRYRGHVHGYLNRCAHQAVELDWKEGEVFDAEGGFLICATHGARYFPDTGVCAGGRCNGRGLVKLPVEERDGRLCLKARDTLHLCASEPRQDDTHDRQRQELDPG